MTSVTSAIFHHAQRVPGRPALIFGDDRLAWSALATQVDRLAALLRVRVPDGRGVALHLPNSAGLAVLFLAATRAGREAQVLDPDWPPEMTEAVLDRLAPGLIVTSDPRLSKPGANLWDPTVPFAAVADALGAPAGHDRLPEPSGDLPFYVGFTSGSTGLPKGYRRTHRSWTESFRGDAIEFGIGPGDVVLAPGTLAHSLFLYAMVHGLHAGATVVLFQRFRPETVVSLLREHAGTVLYGVPTQLRLILNAARQESLTTVRWVLSSGAKWPEDNAADLRRVFPRTRLSEFYGASELSFVTVAKDDEAVPPGSVGRAFPGVAITIRDGEGRLLPEGEQGRIFVESPLVFSGYAITDESGVTRVGDALSVGDLGFLDGGGFLHLVGRERRMIVASGKNIYPEEVEQVLERHAAVSAAAVLGAGDPKRGERLVALVSLRPGARPSRAGLIGHARATLPLYKVPRLYGVIAHWPRTRSGKSDYVALGRLWAEQACGLLP